MEHGNDILIVAIIFDDWYSYFNSKLIQLCRGYVGAIRESPLIVSSKIEMNILLINRKSAIFGNEGINFLHQSYGFCQSRDNILIMG